MKNIEEYNPHLLKSKLLLSGDKTHSFECLTYADVNHKDTLKLTTQCINLVDNFISSVERQSSIDHSINPSNDNNNADIETLKGIKTSREELVRSASNFYEMLNDNVSIVARTISAIVNRTNLKNPAREQFVENVFNPALEIVKNTEFKNENFNKTRDNILNSFENIKIENPKHFPAPGQNKAAETSMSI